MMCAKTGVDERELFRLWIVHRELAATGFEGEQDSRRMARAFVAESRVFAAADSGSNPQATLPIEHRIVNIGLAVPDRFVAPVRRRRNNFIVCTRWRFRITHAEFHLAGRRPHRVKGW